MFINNNNGWINGSFNESLPFQWTLIFGFLVVFQNGKTTTIFQFGSQENNNGFGLYLNDERKLLLRINNHYHLMNTIIQTNQFVNIKITQVNNDIYLYVNNQLKGSVKEGINPFNNYGCFSRAATGGDEKEFFIGIITNVKLYDNIFDFQEKVIKLSYCPNCNNTNCKNIHIAFNPHPCDKEKTDDNDTIVYKICDDCKTVFSDEMMNWSLDTFKEKCYNENYQYYDNHKENAIAASQYIYDNYNQDINYLDCCSNQNLLQKLLQQKGFTNVDTYNIFTDNTEKLNKKYDLITCFGVIEHSYDINEMFKLFNKIINKDGKIVLTTRLYNDENLQEWQSCNPRKGHLLFFTKEGITDFLQKHNFAIEKIETFQQHDVIITIKQCNYMEINDSSEIKLVDYLKDDGKYLLKLQQHGFGDVIMFYPMFKKLQKLFPKCTIDFCAKTGQEYFNSITIEEKYDCVFNIRFPESYNGKSKVERCAIEEIGIPFTPDIDYTFQPNHKIKKIIGVNFIVDSNPGRNLHYDKAKLVWNKIKEMGYIPLEIIFYHPMACYRSIKYDFIDFTTRDIDVNPETTLNMIASCEAFIGVNSGTLVAASTMYPEKCLHLNTSIPFNNYKKFNPIKEIDCHDEINLKDLELFIENIN